MLPLSITSNPLGIILSGAISNVSVISNQYLLSWRIPTLKPHATEILSFAMNNVSTPQYFYGPITSITTLSTTNLTVLRIFNINVPTFYVNKPNNITVSAIYTGTNVSNITFCLILAISSALVLLYFAALNLL